MDIVPVTSETTEDIHRRFTITGAEPMAPKMFPNQRHLPDSLSIHYQRTHESSWRVAEILVSGLSVRSDGSVGTRVIRVVYRPWRDETMPADVPQPFLAIAEQYLPKEDATHINET